MIYNKRMNRQQVALVTGASSGIGKAVAELFAREGYIVYGTSRRACFEQAGEKGYAYTMVPMTLEDEKSVGDAVRYVVQRHRRIDVLVNAAGSGIAGAIEETNADEAKTQFEVCYFGVLRVLGHALPAMRAAGGGTVINIGSMASVFPLPFQGIYSGAKAALYMLTCALRMEIAPFGVRVCQVDPGDTKTGFTDKRALTERSARTAYPKGLTRALYEMIRSEQDAPGPELCAKAVLKMARKKHPPARTVVGAGNKFLCAIAKFAPGSVMRKALRSMYLSKEPPAEGAYTEMLKRSLAFASPDSAKIKNRRSDAAGKRVQTDQNKRGAVWTFCGRKWFL
jgi:short-subunit dehydrogenase